MSRVDKIRELILSGWQTHDIGCPWVVMSKPCLDGYGRPDLDFIRVFPDGRTMEDLHYEAE